MHSRALCVATLMMGFVSAVVAAPLSQAQRVNPDAAVLADFTARVKAYVDLRAKVDNTTPPLTETKDPAKIAAAEKALAEKMRAARAGAKPGDIFTPEIRQRFRSLLHPELKGKDGAETKEVIQDSNPGKVPLQVNGVYPTEAPLSTVPPNILQALPTLSDGLEYRFVTKHLILRDTRANIIVDFILNAIS